MVPPFSNPYPGFMNANPTAQSGFDTLDVCTPEGPPLNSEEMWAAVLRRDRAFDGRFFFGVVTTGVYCRPSCACRKPLRGNVRFFDSAAAAERAGLRPCLRCRPLETPSSSLVAPRILAVCEYIRHNAAEPMPLPDLARRARLSPSYFQRSFKAVTGVTPRQYVESHRMRAFKGALRGGPSVTGAVYEAGFGSGSRAYERVGTALGMTPGEYRSGARGIRISYAAADSPLGRMMIGATARGICFLQFAASDHELTAMLRAEYPGAEITPMPAGSSAEFDRWMAALDAHLRGGEPQPDLPLDIRATAFQMKVWRYLQSIPCGAVESYSEVAAGIGQPSAARAVARACAANRVALLIPCHRVIRGSGELGGYRWGLDRKRALIDRERAARSR
jgi:AraC family transcriptional regulator of adaptative response/methylated-DNA-[protein]-cysteine methyltransferase